MAAFFPTPLKAFLISPILLFPLDKISDTPETNLLLFTASTASSIFPSAFAPVSVCSIASLATFPRVASDNSSTDLPVIFEAIPFTALLYRFWNVSVTLLALPKNLLVMPNPCLDKNLVVLDSPFPPLRKLLKAPFATISDAPASPFFPSCERFISRVSLLSASVRPNIPSTTFLPTSLSTWSKSPLKNETVISEPSIGPIRDLSPLPPNPIIFEIICPMAESLSPRASTMLERIPELWSSSFFCSLLFPPRALLRPSIFPGIEITAS